MTDTRPSPVPNGAEPESYVIHMTFFLNARHSVAMGTRNGPTHAHSWRIDLRLGAWFGDDDVQTPVEFADLDKRVRVVLRPYEGCLLNEAAPFDRVVPTTENVGRLLFGRLGEALAPCGVHLVSVSIWEAPTKGVTVSTPLPSVASTLADSQPAADSGGQKAAIRETAATSEGHRGFGPRRGP